MTSMTVSDEIRHPIEAQSSWRTHLERVRALEEDGNGMELDESHRSLRKDDDDDAAALEAFSAKKKLKEFRKKVEKEKKMEQEKIEAKKIAHKKKVSSLLDDETGIHQETVHGMMIDAGSSGSRMHVYEFPSRTLHSDKEVREAVSGGKLTFPGSDTRWTDRLRPGLSAFALLPDTELLGAVGEYLKPLLDFAEAVMHTKESDFGTFPIYLRATAGLRVLPQADRFRLIGAVRELFSNKTFCPFYFEQEFARTISGEEEAIFGWTGINFVMGNLLSETEGAGTVHNPRLTYGALDMGGASTQISFYEPTGDIMSNLFKLQIGQGKHWNLYAHSFLYYGIDEAVARLEATLINGQNETQRLVNGVHNPCLPGGATKNARTDIHFDANGFETRDYDKSASTGDGFQQAILVNKEKGGDPDACMAFAQKLLHKSQNEWCNFSHRGDCSFAGVYQPDLPTQAKHFGKFLAFSNYYHVWDFLHLAEESSLQDLEAKGRWACSLSRKELEKFNDGRIDDDYLDDYCFKSLFVYQVLTTGYGFKPTDNITAAEVIGGHKVDWAVGAMLYEINTFPWRYAPHLSRVHEVEDSALQGIVPATIAAAVVGAMVALTLLVRRRIDSHHHYGYEEIKGVSMTLDENENGS